MCKLQMTPIFMESSRTTPLINFDPKDGTLEMRGRSSPENAIQFYHHLIQNLEQFSESDNKSFTALFAFEYFNTSSSKCLFDVFKKLVKIRQGGKDLLINWFYEEDDEDIMEVGEDYSDLLDLKFNFIEIED